MAVNQNYLPEEDDLDISFMDADDFAPASDSADLDMSFMDADDFMAGEEPIEQVEASEPEKSNIEKVGERLTTTNTKSIYGLGELAANQDPSTKSLIKDFADPENTWRTPYGLKIINHVSSMVPKGYFDIAEMFNPDAREDVRNANKIVSEEANKILGSKDMQYTGNAAQKFGYEVAEASINMVPALALGWATKNPGASLGMISGQVAGNTYSDYMEKTNDHAKSMAATKFHTLAEVIPETIPVMAILRKTKAGEGVKRMMEATLGEGFQESLTSILQQSYDRVALEEMSVTEAIKNIDWSEVGHDAALGFAVGGVLATPGTISDALAKETPDQSKNPPELFTPTHKAAGGQDVQIATKDGKIIPDTFITQDGQVIRDSNAVPNSPDSNDVSMDVSATIAAVKADIGFEGVVGGEMSQDTYAQGQSDQLPVGNIAPTLEQMNQEYIDTVNTDLTLDQQRQQEINKEYRVQNVPTQPVQAAPAEQNQRTIKNMEAAGLVQGQMGEPTIKPKDSAEVDIVANQAATSPLNERAQPTETEKKASDYEKGRMEINGLPVSIDNPKGSTRSGTDDGGKAWSIQLEHHYGDLENTKGADGDPLDIFLGPDPTNKSLPIFVVNQVNPKTGKFDETKSMAGFSTEEEAKAGYLSNYEKNWKGLGSIVQATQKEFKAWIDSGNTTGEYAQNVKRETIKKTKSGQKISETKKVKAEETERIDQEIVDQAIKKYKSKDKTLSYLRGRFGKKKVNESLGELVDLSFKAERSYEQSKKQTAIQRANLQPDAKNYDQATFIRKSGGIDTNKYTDMGGRLSHLDANNKTFGLPKIEQPGKGMDQDTLEELLTSSGYLQPGQNLEDVLFDMEGKEIYSIENEKWMEAEQEKYNQAYEEEHGTLEAQYEQDEAYDPILSDIELEPQESTLMAELVAQANQIVDDQLKIGNQSNEYALEEILGESVTDAQALDNIVNFITENSNGKQITTRPQSQDAVSPTEESQSDEAKQPEKAAERADTEEKSESDRIADILQKEVKDIGKFQKISLKGDNGKVINGYAWRDSKTWKIVKLATKNNEAYDLYSSSNNRKERFKYDGEFYPTDELEKLFNQTEEKSPKDKEFFPELIKKTDAEKTKQSIEDAQAVKDEKRDGKKGADPDKAKSSDDLFANDGQLEPDLFESQSGIEYKAAIPPQYGDTDYKARGGRIIEMTPDEYIAKVRDLKIDEESQDNIDDLKSMIMDGRELDPPTIYADGKEDGRHRAYAAKQLGIKKIKVLTFEQEQKKTPATKAGKKIKADKEAKIEDFGEKLEGAKKHTFKFREALSQKVDTSVLPLSKSFPKPDYEQLASEGVSREVLVFISELRGEIKSKPRQKWKLKQWSAGVDTARKAANDLINGKIKPDTLLRSMAKSGSEYVRLMPHILKIGNDISPSQIERLGTFKLNETLFSLFNGEENVNKFVVTDTSKSGGFGGMGNQGHFDTVEDAVKHIKEQVQIEVPAKGKGVKFDLWSERGKEGVFLGKKVGTNKYIQLGKFDDYKTAKIYLAENQETLEDMLAKKKKIGAHRKISNDPRIGPDRRNGEDVTPEQFLEEFGFRGVQFGNYVEGPKRQNDLNNAYDGLIDLAELIGIPAKAISLNGELGLAFGARGQGGQGAAAAHYEPDSIVINLTKKEGAGSLAHEWFHSLDNYFARMDDLKSGKAEDGSYMSELDRKRGKVVMAEGRQKWTNLKPEDFPVREEVYNAFKSLKKTILEETKLAERSLSLDTRKGKDYWSTVREMTARSFERYVIGKLKDRGYSSDYLANVLSEEDHNIINKAFTEMVGEVTGSETGLIDPYPYPLDSEMETVNKAYDNLFETIESKETEKGIMLFRKDDTPYSEMDGKPISVEITVESTGETYTTTIDAGETMRSIDDRIEALKDLRGCL